MNTSEFAKIIPLSTGCEIIGIHDCGLIAISKKAGRSSHPNPDDVKGAKPPMIRAPYNFEKEYYSWTDAESGAKHRLWLLNRLDSPTSGVILTSFDGDVAVIVKNEFKERRVKKTYNAICVGKVMPQRGIWNDSIKVSKGDGFVRAKAAFSNKSELAQTEYSVEKFDLNNARLSLVKFVPKTGFTHQLRVQSAKHKFPILGDATYGDFNFNKIIRSLSKINRLFLHCLSTELEFEFRGAKIAFRADAPLPESFKKIMDFNGGIAKKFRLI